jgi:hypothetical protein
MASLALLPVAHLASYVLGLPVHVALTLRCGSDMICTKLEFPTFAGLNDTVGIEISTSGRVVYEYAPAPVLAPEPGQEPGYLAAGEERRLLVDVSPLFSTIKLPGEYDVRFSYVSVRGKTDAPPVRLVFRAPQPAETQLVASVAPDRLLSPTWALWATMCPSTPVLPAAIPSSHPLLFYALLRQLFCGTERPEDIAPSVLDLLPEFFAPEREALQAELYEARGEHARVIQLSSAAPAGLRWWFRMIEGGTGFIRIFHTSMYSGRRR